MDHWVYSFDLNAPGESGVREVLVDADDGQVVSLQHESAGAEAREAKGPGYHVARTFTLAGEGGWDYLTLDTASNRLFIGRSDRVMVVDPSSGTVLGEVSGLDRAHGVAIDYAAGRAFATSGADSTVVAFDPGTLKVLGRTKVDIDDDAILFDPATGHVFTFNGDAHTASVIDPTSGKLVGTIDLGAKPEFGVSDGRGHVYVNLESTSQVAEIDASTRKVIRKWSLAPCESPSGLAIDTEHHVLFSGCHNQVMAMSDAVAGKVVASVPIGRGVDACRYDAGTGLAFASTGDGGITVVREESPTEFEVVQTVETRPGARTMELDPKTHRLYTVTARFGPAPAAGPGQRRRRPSMVPGSFTLLVLQR
jgi:DNA-binding beta-propeller fold protein YncE